MSATLKDQEDAFEVYKQAKQRMDDDLTFDNAKAAREAWWRFLHIFEDITAEPLEK